MSNFAEPQRFDIQQPPATAKSGRSCLFWLLPIGCLGVLLVCGGFGVAAYFGMNAMKDLAPFKAAVESAQNSPEVQEILGDNIQGGWQIQGNISVQNQEGDVDMSIPVTGTKGSGRVHIRGKLINGQWVYDELYFTSDSGDRVDLLGEAVEEADSEFSSELDAEPDFSDIEIDIPAPAGT